MNIFAFMAWAFVQVFILGISVWFFRYGIRVMYERRFLAVVVFLFALAGVYSAVESVWLIMFS